MIVHETNKIVTGVYGIIAQSEKDRGVPRDDYGIKLQRIIDIKSRKQRENRDPVTFRARVRILFFNPSYDVVMLPEEVKQWIENECIEIYRDASIDLDSYRCGLEKSETFLSCMCELDGYNL